MARIVAGAGVWVVASVVTLYVLFVAVNEIAPALKATFGTVGRLLSGH